MNANLLINFSNKKCNMRVIKLYRSSDGTVDVSRTTDSILEFSVVYDVSVSMTKLKNFLKSIPLESTDIAKIQYEFQESCPEGLDYQTVLWCYPTVDKESVSHVVANCLIPYNLCYHGSIKDSKHNCLVTVKSGQPLYFPVENVLDITVSNILD